MLDLKKSFKIKKKIFQYIMLFYDLPLDIKKLVLSYNLGDVRLIEINNSNIIKNCINKF